MFRLGGGLLGELAPDQVLDQGAVPTARLVATGLGTLHHQFLQALSLGRGQLGGAARGATAYQAAPTLDQEVVSSGVDGGGADAQATGDGVDLLVVVQPQQGAELLDQPLRSGPPRQPQPVGQLLDGLAAEGCSRVHGCLLC